MRIDDDGAPGGVITTDFSGEGSDDAFDLGIGGADDAALDLDDMTPGLPIAADLSGNAPAPKQPEEAAPAVTAPAAAAAPKEVQIPAAAAPPPGSQPAAPAPTTEQPQQSFEEHVRANGPALIEHLASTTFALSEDEKAVFGDAAPHVSKLVSKMFLMTQVVNQRALAASLPQLVSNLVQVANRGTETEQKFFGAYPELKDVSRATLANLGYTLRQVHPTLPAEEFFPLMARTAAAMVGKTLAPVRGKAQPYTPAAAGPRGTPAPRGGNQRRQVGVDALGNINGFLRDGE